MAKAKNNQGLEELTQADNEELIHSEAKTDEMNETSESKTNSSNTEADEEGELEPQPSGNVTKAGPKSRKALEEAEAEVLRKEKAAQAKLETPKPRLQQKRNPLKKHGKGYRKVAELVDRTKEYELHEAIELAKQTVSVKFIPSLELHVNLGIDPRQADQMVRASVTLPAGTGRVVRIAVLAPTTKHAEATKAGADIVGEDDLIARIEKGEINFDVLIATPEMMSKLGKLAKTLGPKGLMPNPKSGTVTADVAKAVSQSKAGKVEYRNDKQGIVHQVFGKTSFSTDELLTNVKILLDSILKAKTGSVKGTYIKAISMTTSMGPGIKINVTKAIAESNPRK